MNALPDKQHFEQAAAELAVAPAMVEKDWHVVQILSRISNLHFPDFQIIFSGGTSLSKAHGLIQRFSEDVDFRVISEDVSPKRKTLSDFKHLFVESLRKEGLYISDPIARDGNKYFTANIEYPTLFDRHSALRPNIKLELRVVKSQLPPVQIPVGSFLAKLAGKAPEIKSITCIEPVEIAADKLSALSWRIVDRIRGGNNDDPAIVRHVHDLAVLETLLKEDGRFYKLVAVSMQLDNDTLLKNKQFHNTPNIEKLKKMIGILSADAEYRKEYDQFVKGVSYARNEMEPSFDQAMDALKRIVDDVIAAGLW